MHLARVFCLSLLKCTMRAKTSTNRLSKNKYKQIETMSQFAEVYYARRGIQVSRMRSAQLLWTCVDEILQLFGQAQRDTADVDHPDSAVEAAAEVHEEDNGPGRHARHGQGAKKDTADDELRLSQAKRRRLDFASPLRSERCVLSNNRGSWNNVLIRSSRVYARQPFIQC